MSVRADAADVFDAGLAAQALARAAFGGRGFFTAVRRRQSDGSWSGPEGAFDLETLGLIPVAFTFGEPEPDRRQRLADCALRCGEPGKPNPVDVGILPTPVGEPQGLDTIAFFAACRMACPRAHVVVDLERFGLKLGQLCLSFGADALIGAIVEQRELRLGARAASNELDRAEAAQLLRASGFVPCERLPDGKVRAA